MSVEALKSAVSGVVGKLERDLATHRGWVPPTLEGLAKILERTGVVRTTSVVRHDG